MTWLLKLLKKMSPQIVEAFGEGLQQLLQKLYENALETENEWDDLGVKMIAQVFDVQLEEPVGSNQD